MSEINKSYKKYFRGNLPHIWCPGCGNGIIMGAFAQAIDKLNYDKDEVLAISGIGCSSRMTGYLDFNTAHTTHGRAITVATGAKMAEPQMKTFVITGDGDSAAIGGNHFIHACRRNMDITTIVVNNSIYGMTGGQFSPLTPKGKKATTAPYGNIDRSFDMVDLAKGAGATYVARADIFHVKMLVKLIVAAAKHKGFSVVEVVSGCPISYGRYNNMPTPLDIMNHIKDTTISVKAAEHMDEEKLQNKIVVGELYKDETEKEYIDEYNSMVKMVQANLTSGGGSNA